MADLSRRRIRPIPSTEEERRTDEDDTSGDDPKISPTTAAGHRRSAPALVFALSSRSGVRCTTTAGISTGDTSLSV